MSDLGGFGNGGPWADAHYWKEGVVARPRSEKSDLRALVEHCNQQAAHLAECVVQIRSLMDEVARARARGDHFQAKGRQLLAEVKELRSQAEADAELRGHAEAIRKFPGGWKAMSKAVHPDTAPAGDRAARTEIFKLVNLVFEER